MKIGIRTPSLKKSVSARTTGKIKRVAKRAVNPLYGKKGMGIVNNPKKSIYNKVYGHTTVGVGNIYGSSHKKHQSSDYFVGKWVNTFVQIMGIITLVFGIILLVVNLIIGILSVLLGICEIVIAVRRKRLIKKFKSSTSQDKI